MPPLFRPEARPPCATPFSFGYAVRRTPTMPWASRFVLIGSLATALMLSALSFLVLAPPVWSLTEATDLPYPDKGILFFFAYVLIGLPLSMAPAHLGWRKAFGMPRPAHEAPRCRPRLGGKVPSG